MATVMYVIRHGQREDSKAGGKKIPAARPCDPDITGTGQQQAAETGRALAGKGLSAVYASPFLRTARTASIIARECGLPVRLEWGLAEWFKSEWWKEWPGTIHPEILHKMLGNLEEHVPTGVYPELMMEDDIWAASARYVRTAKALAERHAGRSIALVTHGPALVCITGGLSSWDQKGVMEHRQCGITTLVSGGDAWLAKVINDVSHLSHIET